MLDRTIGQLLERCALRHGPRVAVVHDEQRLTYDEAIVRIRQAGRALHGMGLANGDRVALLMQDRPELLDVAWGAMWAGLAVVPLDAELPPAALAQVVEDSGARVLCHDEAFADRAAGLEGPRLVTLDHLTGLAARQDDGPGLPDTHVDDLAALLYTGAADGAAKGVAHSHRTLVAAFVGEALETGIGEGEVFAHAGPLTHASGAFALPVWLRGGTNVIVGRRDPAALLAAIERHRVTATLLAPPMLERLLDHPGLDGADTASLRTVVYGAAGLGRERLARAHERFGPVLCRVYGRTEAPNQIAVLTPGDHAEALASGDPARLASCGRPVTIADVRLVDDDLDDVPAGEPGEIAVQGPHVMLGYWRRPEETAATLRSGWLRTGDVARADERGFLYLVDRKADMIVSGGASVFPREVEDALLGHDAVRDACVIGVPDPRRGEAVKAYVVAGEGAAVDEAELIAWVRDRRGSALAPASVEVVPAIPRTPVGRHDKPALRRCAQDARAKAVR